MSKSDIFYEDEYWMLPRFGPRYATAISKTDGEHRIYYSLEKLFADFSSDDVRKAYKE